MPRNYGEAGAPGVQGLAQAIAGGAGTRASSFRSGIQALTNMDYLHSRADYMRARTDALEAKSEPGDPNDLADAAAMSVGLPVSVGRQWLASQNGTQAPDPMGETDPQGNLLPQPPTPVAGLTPEKSALLQKALGDLMIQKQLTGKTNFDEFQKGKGETTRNAARDAAFEVVKRANTPQTPQVGAGTVLSPDAPVTPGTDPAQASADIARLLSVVSGKPEGPFRNSTTGVVTDELSGAQNEGGLLAERVRNLAEAKADTQESHGNLYDHQADLADARQTGKGVLAPSEIRTFKAYQEIFPDKSPEEILSIVKSRRTEPTADYAKDQREIGRDHPRWTAERVNAEADARAAGRDRAMARGRPETTRAQAAPPAAGGKYAVGQVVTKGGKNYKVTGFDKDGEPLVVPSQ